MRNFFRNQYPPPYRSRRRHDWRGWIVALAALVLLASGCWLATAAQASALPPVPGTHKTAPAPVGRHEMRLYCRHFLPPGEAAKSAECRRVGGYR